jgi:peptide-methionine (S)-S-oxide reductase
MCNVCWSGGDHRGQYRSLLAWLTPEQETIVRASFATVQEQNKSQVTTSIEAATNFYRAEEYHQNYLNKNGA